MSSLANIVFRGGVDGPWVRFFIALAKNLEVFDASFTCPCKSYRSSCIVEDSARSGDHQELSSVPEYQDGH
jgi:hypothetical protein